MRLRFLLQLSGLSAALAGCGWTTYTFVDASSADVSDIAPPDDAFDAVDAVDAVTDDAADATDAPVVPTAHWAIIAVQSIALTGVSTTISRSNALFIERANPTGHPVTQESVLGFCTTVTRNQTIFPPRMVTGTSVGTITLSNGSAMSLLNFNPSTQMYTPMNQMPRLWQDGDTMSITWPGTTSTGGDEPPGSYQLAFGTPPDFTAPIAPDGGMYALDPTQPLHVTWVPTSEPVLIWLEQAQTDALVDIVCAAQAPSGSTNSFLNVMPGSMSTLTTGPASLWMGAGHFTFNGVVAAPGPLLVIVQSVSRFAQISVM